MSSKTLPPITAGFWACTNIEGCCYNNNGSTMNPPHWENPNPPSSHNGKPEGANLAINFTGLTGINQVHSGVPPFGRVTAAEVPATGLGCVVTPPASTRGCSVVEARRLGGLRAVPPRCTVGPRQAPWRRR